MHHNMHIITIYCLCVWVCVLFIYLLTDKQIYLSVACYVNTLFAHYSCIFLLILLFIKSTVYCPVHYFIAHFILYFTYFLDSTL